MLSFEPVRKSQDGVDSSERRMLELRNEPVYRLESLKPSPDTVGLAC